MKAGESPGQIRNQLGRSLNAIREAVAANDVALVMNQVAVMRSMLAPFMGLAVKPDDFAPRTFHEAYAAIVSAEDCDPSQQFQDDMLRVQIMLLAAARHQVYAWNHTEVGDASHLADLAASEETADE